MAKSKNRSFCPPPRILTRGRIVHNVAILTVCLLLSFWGFVGVAPADIVPSDQLTTFFSDNFHVIDNAGQAYPNINTRSNDMEDRFNGGLLGPINYNKTGGGSEWTAQIRNPNENLLIAARKSNNETHISPAYDFGSNLGTSTPAEEGGRTNEISFKVFPDSNNIGGDNWAAFIFGVDSSGCTAHVNKSSGIGLFLRRSGAYQIFNGNSSIATDSVTPGADGYIDVRVQYTIPADGSSASQIQIYFNDELIQEISKTLTGNYFQFEGANYTTSYSHHLYKNLVVKSSANYNYDISNADVFALDKNWTTNGLDKRDVLFLSERSGASEADHTGTIALGADTEFNVASGLTLTQSGVISGTGVLNKTGEGALTLSGANTYTDGTTISDGILKLTGAGTLGTGAVTNSGTLEFNNSNATITPNISGAGDILVSAGTATLTGAVSQTGGATTLADGTTLNIGSASTLYNLSGGSESNPATLTVNGDLTLSNDDESTFIGSITAQKITVNTVNDVALKLYAGADNKITASSLTVSSGELDFKGYFEGNIEVFNGSIFSPGNSIGTADITGNITFADATADSNGVALFEFGEYANGADVNHDLFVMENGGIFTADDGVILLDFANNDVDDWATEGNKYKLVSNGGFTDEQDYTSWLATTPDYSSLFKLTGGADGLYLVGIKAAPEPGSGVPEPSTWALMALGVVGLMYVRKRTRK